MTTQHIETLIIGAGQAGLATGYQLQRLGHPFLVVDRNERIGDNWRQQWDTLKLYSPAKYDGLPGLPFPAPPWSYPGKEDVADYLEKYAIHADLPVRMSTPVDRLEARPEGGFTAYLGSDTITCDNVVVATGTFGRTPNVPAFAAELDPGIRQLHSSEYRRPAQIADGPVLVVGASHSGCDIAYEVAEHRPTTLVGPDRGQIPVKWNSRAIRFAIPDPEVRVEPRADPEDTDRTQGDARDPPPRRTHAARQARRPGRAWSGSPPGPSRGRQGRPAPARRRHGRRGRHRRVVHGLQAGLRLDRPAGLRRRRLSPRSTAGWWRPFPASSSAGWPSSTPSARWSSWVSGGMPSTSPSRSTGGCSSRSSRLAQGRLPD